MNPYIIPLVIVIIVNIIVLALVYVLFKVFKSKAGIEGTQKGFKWYSGGALAGFIILTFLEVRLVDNFTPQDVALLPSYTAVKKFYTYQQKHEFEKSWTLLHPQFQKKRWNNNKTLFLDGYKNTLGMKNLSITLLSEGSPGSHDYIVYYVDEVESPVLDGLASLENKTVRELNSIIEGVENLKHKVRDNGFSDEVISNLTLSQLLAPDRGNKVTWLLKEDSGKDASDLFPNKIRVTVQVGVRILMNKHDGEWLIRKISTFRTS